MGHDTTKPDGSWPFKITSDTIVDDGNWHMVTCVRDASQDWVYIYVDGGSPTSETDTTTLSLVNR